MKHRCAIKLLFFTILLCSLTSCGFHLRGHIAIPKELDTLYIKSATPFAQFEQILRDTLRTYRIDVVTDVKQSPVILDIINAKLTQVTGAISADLQQRQYTLNYQVSYQLLSSSGTVVIPPTTVTSSTTFTTDLAQMVTSSNNTTEQYLPSLQHDAVFRMLSRILSSDNRKALRQYFQKHALLNNENKS